MKVPFSSRIKSPRTVSLDGVTNNATSRPTSRYPEPPAADPVPFEPMRIKRLSPMRASQGLVIDMEPVEKIETRSQSPQPGTLLIRASQSRLAARVTRLRAVVSELRIEIENLSR